MHNDPHDEIDLLELFDILWHQKLTIIGVTALASALALLAFIFTPVKYEGELRISALDTSQIAAYATLNDTPGLSRPIYAEGALIGQEGVILSENLFQSVLDEIAKGQVFGRAHEISDPFFQNFTGSQRQLREALNKVGSNYRFTPNDESETSGTLNFVTAEPETTEFILKQAFKLMNENIRRDNLAAVNALQKSIETSLAFAIEEIEAAIDSAQSNYRIEMTAYLAKLREQAAIAREVNITGTQSASSNGPQIGFRLDNESPLYFRGYKALEKEIKLIENRGSGDDLRPFIDGYSELASQLQRLKDDKRLDRLATGIAVSPLADSALFKPANVELDNIVYKPSLNKGVILLLIAFLTLIVTSAFVLFRHFLSEQSKVHSG